MSDRFHECDVSFVDTDRCPQPCGRLHVYCGVCDRLQGQCDNLAGSSEDYAFLLANVRDAVGDDE